MKTYKHLFERIVSHDNIDSAIMEASKGKRNRRDVVKVLNNKEKFIKKIQNMLINDTYRPVEGKSHIINENDSTHKTRDIKKPHFVCDQIIHHAIIQVMKPYILKSMYYHAYGSMPDKGVHKASKFMNRWIKNRYKHTKYFLKLDIHHFYKSIDKDILKQKLAKKFKDNKLLNLLFRIIDSSKKGLPLGFYTSQWFAYFYLTELDHFINEKLHCHYYVRYMDDIVILGAKKTLKKIKSAIKQFLLAKLHLKMKSNYQIALLAYQSEEGKKSKRGKLMNPTHCREFHFYRGRFIDFMGFRFYRDKLILRKQIMLKAVRKQRKVSNKALKFTPNRLKGTSVSLAGLSIQDLCSYISRKGMIFSTDCFHLYMKYFYKQKPNFKMAAKELSRRQRLKSRILQNKLKVKIARGPNLSDLQNQLNQLLASRDKTCNLDWISKQELNTKIYECERRTLNARTKMDLRA